MLTFKTTFEESQLSLFLSTNKASLYTMKDTIAGITNPNKMERAVPES